MTKNENLAVNVAFSFLKETMKAKIAENSSLLENKDKLIACMEYTFDEVLYAMKDIKDYVETSYMPIENFNLSSFSDKQK